MTSLIFLPAVSFIHGSDCTRIENTLDTFAMLFSFKNNKKNTENNSGNETLETINNNFNNNNNKYDYYKNKYVLLVLSAVFLFLEGVYNGLALSV